MSDTIGQPGGLMESRSALIMKLCGLELGQVDTTKLGSLWIFRMVWNVAGGGWGEVSVSRRHFASQVVVH